MVLNRPEPVSQAVQEQNTSIMSLKYGTAYLNTSKNFFRTMDFFEALIDFLSVALYVQGPIWSSG